MSLVKSAVWTTCSHGNGGVPIFLTQYVFANEVQQIVRILWSKTSEGNGLNHSNEETSHSGFMKSEFGKEERICNTSSLMLT